MHLSIFAPRFVFLSTFANRLLQLNTFALRLLQLSFFGMSTEMPQQCCTCRAGRNPGGRSTKKQCSLCKAANRDGLGHRAPQCPFRDMDDIWQDHSKPRSADTAMEAEARAAATARKLKEQAAMKDKAVKLSAEAEAVRKATEELQAANQDLKRAKGMQEGKETPLQPSTPKAQEDVGKSGGVSPHDLLASKKGQRNAVFRQQQVEKEVKRLKKASKLFAISEDDEKAKAVLLQSLEAKAMPIV